MTGQASVPRGIERASKTLKNIRGAWIAKQKVEVEKGKVVEYRVTMRVTFVPKD
jgi:flavin-binding protein dodecin